MVNKFKLDSTNINAKKEAIARTIEIASNYAGELSIEVLPLDKIEIDPENNRELSLTLHDALHGIDDNDPECEKKKEDWKSLESLAKTIRDDQLINPIFVYRFGNKCRLIAGERRTLASAIAGKKEIIARIASQRPVGSKLRVLQWIENNERVDLKLSERIANLEAIIKEYQLENKENDKTKITQKVLSDLTGMSNTQSRRYLLLINANPEIKEAIKEGRLENIKLAELLCSIEQIDHQKELLNSALLGKTFDSIVKLKNELEQNQKKKKELKGRRKLNVNLGTVKPNIAKIIIEALTSCGFLEEKSLKQLNLLKKESQWSNSESIEKAFKHVVSLLEEVEA